MEIIAILAVGIMNILCFVIGAIVGQKVSKDEDVELPSINPFEAIRERESRREAEAEQKRIDTILRNIETYDGSGIGQEDVPRG